ncbi:MAG TPA: hypothetical protein VI076_03690 [Actinopolymorphaceae bacterium]
MTSPAGVGNVDTPVKRAHLRADPYVACNYWNGAEAYDTCVAECRAELLLDERSRREGWERFASAPPLVGYDRRSSRRGATARRARHGASFVCGPGECACSRASSRDPAGRMGRVLTWQSADT